MRRHSDQTPHAPDPHKRAVREKRSEFRRAHPPSKNSRHVSSGRKTPRHEPEPIVVPPEWRLSPDGDLRKRRLRTAGKIVFALAAFGLLTVPFILNQREHGSFYYQEKVSTEPVQETQPDELKVPAVPPDETGTEEPGDTGSAASPATPDAAPSSDATNESLTTDDASTSPDPDSPPPALPAD